MRIGSIRVFTSALAPILTSTFTPVFPLASGRNNWPGSGQREAVGSVDVHLHTWTQRPLVHRRKLCPRLQRHRRSAFRTGIIRGSFPEAKSHRCCWLMGVCAELEQGGWGERRRRGGGGEMRKWTDAMRNCNRNRNSRKKIECKRKKNTETNKWKSCKPNQ